jgi:hypothetical protein
MANTHTTGTGTPAAARPQRVIPDSEIKEKVALADGKFRVKLKNGEELVMDTNGRIIQGA